MVEDEPDVLACLVYRLLRALDSGPCEPGERNVDVHVAATRRKLGGSRELVETGGALTRQFLGFPVQSGPGAG